MKNETANTALPKTLVDELKVLVTEAETIMTRSPSATSADALGSLHARFDAAQERFSDLYTGAKKQVVAGARCTDGAIRENPYETAAIALGVGALLGALAGVLVGRRRS